MSNWKKYRREIYSMGWLLWPLVVALWLCMFSISPIDTKGYGPVDSIMCIVCILYLIFAIWGSIPPKDPPEE